jgi:hypothetical protein
VIENYTYENATILSNDKAQLATFFHYSYFNAMAIYQNSIAGCAAEILQTATEIVKQENSLSDSSDG